MTDAFAADEVIGEVRDLIGEVGRLGAENEKLSDAFAKLKAEHQAAKDELARLKKRPPRKRRSVDGRDRAPRVERAAAQKMPGTRAGHCAWREAY
jgi:hypothetical protein